MRYQSKYCAGSGNQSHGVRWALGPVERLQIGHEILRLSCRYEHYNVDLETAQGLVSLRRYGDSG